MIEEVIAHSATKKSPLYDAYRARVLADGGTVELNVAQMREHYELLPEAQFCQIASGRKANKLYTIKPNNSLNDIPCDRASKATAWGKNGKLLEVANGIPALDWDTITGRFLGVNISRQSTNRIASSSNTTYNLINTSLVNPAVWAHTDLYTHAVFVGNNTLQRTVSKTTTLSGLGDIVISAFVEMTDGSEPMPGEDSDPNADFCLFIGGGNVLNVNRNGRIFKRKVTNTIWYVSGYCNYSGTSTNNYIRKHTLNSPKTFRIVGFMLENSNVPGRHVVTSGTAATKLYDNFNRDIALNVASCTIYADIYLRYCAAATPYGVIFNCPDANNRMIIGCDAQGRASMMLTQGGTTLLHIKDSGAAHGYSQVKIAGRFENGNFALFVNGEKFETFLQGDNEVENPFTITTRMILGEMSSNMNFRSVKVLPACTDAQLKSLTSP